MSWVLDTCYQKYCLSLVGVNPYRMKDKVNYLRCCLFVKMRLVEIQLIFSHFPFFQNRMLITYNINITYNELLSGLVNDSGQVYKDATSSISLQSIYSYLTLILFYI